MTAEGDTQAMVAEVAEPVFKYLRRYCGDEQLAQDLAQETLLRVVRAHAGFDGRASPKT